MQIIGIKHSTITFKDGRQVTGYNLYLSEKRPDIQGVYTESVFVSDTRAGDYKPQLNDHVTIYYNKWAKVEKIIKYDEK